MTTGLGSALMAARILPQESGPFPWTLIIEEP